MFLRFTRLDPQASSVTFWNVGTLSGASWSASIVCGLCFLIAPRYSKALNLLMLGEENTLMLGANITMMKKNVKCPSDSSNYRPCCNYWLCGLIAPHLIRILIWSNNRYLIIDSVKIGQFLLTNADLISMLLLTPVEIPIEVVTSYVKVSIFLYLLKKKSILILIMLKVHSVSYETGGKKNDKIIL